MATSVALPDSLEARYELVRERIARAAVRSGRRAEDVMLVAVTKAAEPEQIRTLMELGHRDFGENRVQQLLQRAAMVEEYFARLKVHTTAAKSRRVDSSDSLFLPKPAVVLPAGKGDPANPIRWHMIGHLQRNKARKITEFVRLIHSLDSLRLAEELQAIAVKRDEIIEVLLEVNCSGEASKYGCPLPAAIALAEQVETMVNVRIRGLMTMAPYSDSPEDARPAFARCRELFEEMAGLGLSEGKFNILSMGMSGDFEVAISEGANIVRVGTSIFGQSVRPQGADADDED